MSVIVLTRAERDAAPLIASVVAHGFQPLVEPMLTIEHLPGPEIVLAGAQALLFTSANAVRAFAARTGRRELPVYAVGDATADAAEEAGFPNVTSAAGAARDLANLVLRSCSPAAGTLVHPSGQHVAADLGSLLSPSGFSVDRMVVYAAHSATRLSDELHGSLLAGTVFGCVFYSPRGSATFARLVQDSGLEACCRKVAAFCISSAAADSLKHVHWRTLAVAARPTQDAMIDLLDQECAGIPHHDA